MRQRPASLLQAQSRSSLPAAALLLLLVAFEAQASCSPSLGVPGGQLGVEWSQRITPEQCPKLSEWLQSAARATSELHGVFPCLDCRVEIDIRRSGGGPVPWAHVERGSPTVVEFNVNPVLPLENFLEDWTAVHEFSHLFIPFPGNRDIWFTEGLATYYQNILRARAGLLDPKAALWKLHEGFERGRDDDAYSHLTLRQLSPRMWSTGSYMRVYWSGVAYFFNIDMELRRRSDGRQSLDTVLAAFHECCRDDSRAWNARSLARKFDELSGTELFSTGLEEVANGHTVPDVVQSWRRLGVRLRSGDPVLKDDAVLRRRPQALLDP